MRLSKRKMASVSSASVFSYSSRAEFGRKSSLQIPDLVSGIIINPGQTVVVDVTASGGPFNGIILNSPPRTSIWGMPTTRWRVN